MSKKDNNPNSKKSILNNTGGYIDISTKREIWKEIGEKLGGKFRISFTAGNVLEIHRLFIPHKKWEIKISESDTRPLKFEIKFETNKDYELTLGPEDYIEKLLKHLGKREIEIGNNKFDNHYFIKSNDEVTTLKFLSKEITRIILKHNVYSLNYCTDSGKNTSTFTSTVSRTVEKMNEFIELIYLHIKIIDKLVELNLVH